MTTPVSGATFDAAFSEKVAALFISDQSFAREAASYLKPEFFENVVDRNLVMLVGNFVKKYGSVPEPTTLIEMVKDAGTSAADLPVYVKRVVHLSKMTVTDRGFVRDKTNEFCKRQSLLILTTQMPALIEKGRYDKIEQSYKAATSIGVENTANFSDYFDGFERRQELRDAYASGSIIPGVTTGFPEIDDRMYRKGYIRSGLTAIMAPSKRGKTALMGQSALYSAMAGSNVLYISLEVSQDIFEDRMDAALTSTSMNDLIDDREKITAAGKLTATSGARGKLYVETRPSNTFSAKQVDALVETYFNTGRPVDLVFVDYIGIMRLDDPKDRYVGLGNAAKQLRATAGRFNVAIVTGAQTNRDAVNKETSGMESIGESFAIVQDCDLLMSINANEAEMAAGVRRIHWAAARNEAACTIEVHGDLERMQLIQRVMGVRS